LDSAFRDLRTVAEELVSRGRIALPQFLTNMAFEVIRSEVASRACFDPGVLVPLESAQKAVCPAMFAVASDDCFVLPHHTQDLYDAWGGQRELRVFDGNHNGARPTWFLEEAADFLVMALCGNGIGPGVALAYAKPTVAQHASSTSNCGRAAGEGDGDALLDIASESPSQLPEATTSGGRGGKRPPVPQGDLSHTAQGCSEEAVKVNPPTSPQGLDLFEQLRYLGFPDSQCQAAVRRCLSADRAIQWLSTQQVSVTL
jgi:hypothetical protein